MKVCDALSTLNIEVDDGEDEMCYKYNAAVTRENQLAKTGTSVIYEELQTVRIFLKNPRQYSNNFKTL